VKVKVKVKVKVTRNMPRQHRGRELYSVLNSALEEGMSVQRDVPAVLTLGITLGTNFRSAWVCWRGGGGGQRESTGTENRKFLAYNGVRSPDRPAHSQLLYRLVTPAHPVSICVRA
jgi:hypothetical protein